MRKTVFTKHAANPILSPDAFPEDVMYVFNPGAIKFNDEYLLMCDAALGSTNIVFWLARSKDGVHFTPDPEPIEWPHEGIMEFCVYDPRITRFGDEYLIMYASHQKDLEGPRVGMVKTRDFKHFERIFQEDRSIPNRNAVLFPEKIGGHYVRFDRPMKSGELGQASMCISYSDDLSRWYDTKEFMQPRAACWDNQKIGGAAVPIKTPEGWLAIYHGVDAYSCNDFVYKLGIMLLDLNNPSKILYRSEAPVLYPDKTYEFIGRTSNVVFSCNALEENGHIRMYYGAGDTCIGLAEAELEDLLVFVKRPNRYFEKFYERSLLA